ncbi:MAG: hypothetical protein ACI4L9_07140 [Candidatus Coproplasma sp.]
MKKKLIALTALLTASVSMFSFTACGGNNDNLTLEPSDAKTTNYVESVLDATEKAPIGVNELNISLSMSGGTSSFVCDEDGNVPAGSEKQVLDSQEVSASLTADGLWNANGQIDATALLSLTGDNEMDANVLAYLREGYLFYAFSQDKTADLTTTALEALDVSELISNYINVDLTELLSEGNVSYSSVTTLALRYGTVDLGNGNFELDFDKAIASLVKDFLQTFDALTEDTTVGALMETNVIKNVIDSLLGDFTAQELYDTITGMITQMAPDYAPYLVALIPVPAETDQTAYDYLVTVINDETVSMLLCSMISIDA